MRIGYLHYRSEPQRARLAYTLMAVAHTEGFSFVYFTPRGVMPDTREVRGWVYEEGAWREAVVPYPDVVINEALRTEKHADAVHAMRKVIPFTSHPVGDKLSVYERLRDGGLFRVNLLPTVRLSPLEPTLREWLATYREVVVKPVAGNRGIGVWVVEALDSAVQPGSRVRWRLNQVAREGSLAQLTALLAEAEKMTPLLVQQRVEVRNRDGLLYDFRIHVQKNGAGEWTVSSVYPRIAPAGHITTNLYSGGYTCPLDHFLEREFAGQAFDIARYLEQFGLHLARHMDTLYDDPLDELGIDIALDEQRVARLFEVNWKPGPPPMWYLELDHARNVVAYAAFLARQAATRRA
ncbi:MAG: YheC/YheD family protein [Thermoflavifilum sp.]|nr:YheC/YheD family protein [Thermoflavifilum sp.]MCL6513787.1 YheC/YheD family protein [Alicyclobacillus sp.]